ncbi:MAG: hypothetical protein MJK04_27125, partial [Psychrosphaera sp.]|nr:hypothetical protein [Psychrosphaera sp.]
IESFAVQPWLEKHPFSQEACCFICSEPFNYVSLSLPPESLHYGFTVDTPAKPAVNSADSQTRYLKTLKTSTGKAASVNIPFVDAPLGIIDISTLAQNIKTTLGVTGDFNSARIGRYLLEGEAKAEITLGVNV